VIVFFPLVQLYILRHGEAGKRMAGSSSGKDSERALTVAGRQEVEEVVEALFELGLEPDFIATSPLRRARQTADVVAKRLKVKKASLEEWDELKPEGRLADLYKKLSQFKPGSEIIIVGHEPQLSTAIAEVVFGKAAAAPGKIVLKKAGLAKVSITSFQPSVQGELRWLLAPKHMKRMV
jgi:phosphohistidine phosphatase